MLIVDIDGTLFDNYHREHLIPEDKTNTAHWERFNAEFINDKPLPIIIQEVKTVAAHLGELIFLTSRPENFFDLTIDKLNEHFDNRPYQLMMRQCNDQRHPTKYKKCAIGKIYKSVDTFCVLWDNDQRVIDMVRAEYPKVLPVKVPCHDCTVPEEFK